jgi:hypothetical protein
MTLRPLRLAPLILLTACALQDSHIAHSARTRLLGLSEVDLESCLGVPDQHASFGNTDVLTYYATSQSSTSYALPVVGGFSFSNGGYCHATFQVKDGHVTQLVYTGEKKRNPRARCLLRADPADMRGKLTSIVTPIVTAIAPHPVC